MLKYFLAVISFSLSILTNGQENVNGVIIDTKGNPISYAKISVVNSNIETSSDINGEFTLTYSKEKM